MRYNLGLVLRFLLELAALISLAMWGADTGQGTIASIVLAIVTPLAAAAVWGAFVAPRARWPVHRSIRLPIELAVFGAAFAALQSMHRPMLAAAFALAVALDYVLLRRPTDRGRPM